MKLQWLLALAPLIGLTVNVLFQISSARLLSHAKKAILIGLTGGFVTTLVLLFSISSGKGALFIGDVCVGLLTYFALAFCFWTILNLSLTSIRIRILRELLKNDSQGLSSKNLLAEYTFEEIISRRAARLEAMGEIVQREGRWTLRSKRFLVLALVFSALRKLIIPSDPLNERVARS